MHQRIFFSNSVLCNIIFSTLAQWVLYILKGFRQRRLPLVNAFLLQRVFCTHTPLRACPTALTCSVHRPSARATCSQRVHAHKLLCCVQPPRARPNTTRSPVEPTHRARTLHAQTWCLHSLRAYSIGYSETPSQNHCKN